MITIGEFIMVTGLTFIALLGYVFIKTLVEYIKK